ncbi:MAG: hypothetical protein R3B40_18170 [Polyangiales bacterium]
MRIAYVGPGAAGKYTSMAFLVDHFGTAPTGAVLPDTGLPLRVRSERATWDVTVSRHGARAQYDYADWDSAAPVVRAEIESMAEQDAFVFVFDAQVARLSANLDQWRRLRTDLAWLGVDVDDVLVVVQLNKVDLPSTLSVSDARAQLRHEGPVVESVAVSGVGVVEAIEQAAALVAATPASARS